MKYKILIFDFDGTIADTITGVVKAFQETFLQMGIPVPDEDMIKSAIGLELVDACKYLVKELSEEKAKEAAAIYKNIFLDIALPTSVPFPGTIETIKALHEMGFTLAVASSRGHQSLEVLADKVGIKPYFSGIYGAEDVVNHKPAPDLVNLILDNSGFTKDEALVIGDATFDLLMGKGAGCSVCGVTWGNQRREKLLSVGPDHIIDHIEDLLNIVR